MSADEIFGGEGRVLSLAGSGVLIVDFGAGNFDAPESALIHANGTRLFTCSDYAEPLAVSR